MEEPPRKSTLWPMPGGVGNYLGALGAIIRAADDTGEVPSVLQWIVDAHGLTGEKTAISYLRLADTLGFLEVEGQSVFVAPEGQRYLDGADLAELTADALLRRVSACREILEALSTRPRSTGGLSTILKTEGYQWSTSSQLRYRLRWLEEVGLVLRGEGPRPIYSLRTTLSIPSR